MSLILNLITLAINKKQQKKNQIQKTFLTYINVTQLEQQEITHDGTGHKNKDVCWKDCGGQIMIRQTDHLLNQILCLNTYTC